MAQAKLKISDQIENWHKRYKNGNQFQKWCKLMENWNTQIEKWYNTKTVQANGKLAHQIEKWCKRSFYQGPGVKFPISWEKITLPPSC